jgi:hypothetical protein
MLSFISSVFLSALLASRVAAAPAESSNDVLARLEGRKVCNAGREIYLYKKIWSNMNRSLSGNDDEPTCSRFSILY